METCEGCALFWVFDTNLVEALIFVIPKGENLTHFKIPGLLIYVVLRTRLS